MSTYVDKHTRRADAPADVLFHVACGVGGEHGWYSPGWIWELRGILDRLLGGPGMARKRKHSDRLEIGDTVGFWRVTHLKAPYQVYLLAEMKVPGVASLEFDIEPEESGNPGECASYLTQTAKFETKGLLGHAYWWLFFPAHRFIFRRMLKGMVQVAEKEHNKTAPGRPSTDQE
jgi:hypothetical protein